MSPCISDNFADYVGLWKHNGYWLFDSPEIILVAARENSIDVTPTTLFYYEVHELEFDGKSWNTFAPNFPWKLIPPARKRVVGVTSIEFSRAATRMISGESKSQ